MEAGMLAGQPQQAPDQMPEIPREIQILRGAATSLTIRVNELLDKLDPVVRPSEPSADVAMKVVGSDQLPVTTRHAVELREITKELGTLEDRVSYTSHRLEL